MFEGSDDGKSVSGETKGENVADYERSMAIDAPPEDVFAWLTDINNLPGYLPPSPMPRWKAPRRRVPRVRRCG